MNEAAKNLKILSKIELLLSAEEAVKTERQSTVQVIRHFREIERRRLYLEKGYSSLFEMAVSHFGFSRAGAQRRINFMRLVRDMPEVEEQIQNGKLTLSAAASVQSFFREKKNIGLSERRELIARCLSKSAREVEKELASRDPTMDKRDDIRYNNGERLRLCVNISEELYQKLETLKHRYRLSKIEEVIQLLADRAWVPSNSKPTDKIQDSLLPKVIPVPTSELKTRYISKVTKKIVIKQNPEKKCSYIDPVTQQRCNETDKLQFDHIMPHSKGGPNLAENLRLLCGHHNRLVWTTEQRHLYGQDANEQR